MKYPQKGDSDRERAAGGGVDSITDAKKTKEYKNK